MLNKIAIFTFCESIAATALLRWHIPQVDSFLKPFSFMVGAEGFSFPLGTILPAFIVAFISRAFKLHDRLSDLFNIRLRFDVQEILKPMALAAGVTFSIEAIERLKNRRNKLMNDLFYQYASSTPGKAKIDGHYISLALDQWTW